ncbi:hypothetical protein D9615_000803 [Tricholomella constricta]|uniref:Uncharacterized protein n=1 Tax=Tricholomella constricta TaxID=117010 RepID=A0A8H5HRV9_9AGAR|nr:hypothetical protein D9615_000803 [Tricholomella constricta]
MASLTTLCPENGINIMSSYGYSLLGSFFLSALWGASTLQVFIYFMNSADSDPTAVNVLIACLWVLDTVNEILVLKSNWPVLILNYGKLAGLAEIQPELMHHIWVQSIVVFVVQMYFIRRIYTFGKLTFPGKSMAITMFAIPLALLATGRVG